MFKTQRRFWLAMTIAFAASFVIACGQGGLNLGALTCNLESDNQVDWEQKPTLNNGTLTMKGSTKGGKQIHDPVANAGRFFSFAAFTLHDVQSDDEDGMRQLGVIYPDEARGKTGSGAGVKLFTDNYNVESTESSSSFDVQVEIPQRLMDYELAVAVWGKNVGINTERPIGAGCVNK